MKHRCDSLEVVVLPVLAYTWVVTLDSQAVALEHAHPLVVASQTAFRRLRSLFRGGLDFFVEFLQRYSIRLGLPCTPDHRLTGSCPLPSSLRGTGWEECHTSMIFDIPGVRFSFSLRFIIQNNDT